MNPISHTLDEQTVFQRLARRALNQKDSRVKHSLLEDISNRTKFPLLPNTSVFIDRKGNYLNDSKD